MGLIMRDSVPYAGSNDIVLTQAQYDALVQAGEVLPNVNYYISNANHSTPIYASGVHYDNTNSGLDADDVQEAIDELSIVESDTYTIATYGGTIKAKKYGNVVTITALSIGNTTTITTGNEPTLYTLPSKYRPTAEITIVGFVAVNFNSNKTIGYTITTGGDIKVYAYQDISKGRFSCTYIV